MQCDIKNIKKFFLAHEKEFNSKPHARSRAKMANLGYPRSDFTEIVGTDIAKRIFSFLIKEERVLAKLVCKTWRLLIESNRDSSWIWKCSPNSIMEYGLKKRSEMICVLAWQWGATDYSALSWMFAYYGDTEMCEEWLPYEISQYDATRMLDFATEGGQKRCCMLAKEKGARDYDRMLGKAARWGHIDLCTLAKEWGATNFGWMLQKGAKGGHRHICKLAKKWGANFDWMQRMNNSKGYTIFDWMLRMASSKGHTDLCILAKKWGATNFNWMLIESTEQGYYNLILLAKEWGADDFNSMLQEAALSGNANLCVLAKEWGANDFYQMLKYSRTRGYPRLCDLAKKWDVGINSIGKAEIANNWYSDLIDLDGSNTHCSPV